MHARLNLSGASRLAFTALLWIVAQGGASGLLAQSQDYLVTFRDGTIPLGRALAAQRAGAAVRSDFDFVNVTAVRVPNANALAALRDDPSVLAITPDRPIFAIQNANGNKPNAPGGGKKGGGGGAAEVVPAGVARVGAPVSGSDGGGVGVAVLDTGIDLTHPDLQGTVSLGSAFGDTCQDQNGHGTHVAGIVAARNNDVDVVGVAPAAQLYCFKVLDSAGGGSDSTVIAGLEAVLDNNGSIRIVNMSLGRAGSLDEDTTAADGETVLSPLRAAVKALYDAGIVVVVAAGNDANVEVTRQVPATYPEVLAVASTTATAGANQCRFYNSFVDTDTASYFTTDGPFDAATNVGVTISAPGADREDIKKSCFLESVGILSTRLGGGTTRMSGTSMAAPHVAGVVARLLQNNNALGVEDVRSVLRADSDRRGSAPLDSPSGAYTFDGEREGVAQAPVPIS